MRDLFDLLGLPFNAAASEVRRVCARRTHPVHPDFRASIDVSSPAGIHGLAQTAASDSCLPHDAPAGDVAVDFVTMATFVERMQAGFFRNAE